MPEEAAAGPSRCAEEAERILGAHRAGDFFACLRLAKPRPDALGRPSWPLEPADVKRAFRKAAVRVHPDKHPGDELAAEAFGALNEAQEALADAERRADLLKRFCVHAETEDWGAAGGRDGGSEPKGSKLREGAALLQQEGAAMADRVKRQMEEKREKLKRVREAKARAAAREGGPGTAGPGPRAGGASSSSDSDSSEDEGASRAAQRRRRNAQKRNGVPT